MHDNKVSEKAIWEGSITPDETPITVSQALAQPQMMFCYKCNQVIPGNSTFCPYCQVKLFTECPKCGMKYSSQYPACSQCGENREEYLRAQRLEQEIKRQIEIENRRQRELENEKIIQLQIEAGKIKEQIEKECSKACLTPCLIIMIILLLLSFAIPFMLVPALIWALVGGIWMIFKCYNDIDKKKQEWRDNHPNDPIGSYL